MKKFFLLALLFCTAISFAQTPSTIISSLNDYGISADRVTTTNNPYYGAELLYNISGDVSNSLLFGGHTMYIPVMGESYAIPVLTNLELSVGDSTSNQSEWFIGAYPYYTLIDDGSITLNLHGGLAYQILNNDVTENELRSLIGLEVAFYGLDRTTPITLSVAPEFTRRVQSKVNSSQLSVTFVIPVAKGLGLIGQGSIPFDDGSTLFQFGMLLNGTNR